MKRTTTTKATTRLTLGIATVLLAMLDWMAGATIAEPDGPQGAPPPDEMVPAGASLENATSSTLRIGAVALRIVPAGVRYVLEATNRGDAAAEVEVDVKVLEATVMPMARMAPMPQEVSSAKVALTCPAHQTIRRALELPGLAAATAPAANAVVAPNGPNTRNAGNGVMRIMAMPSFTTRTFYLADAAPAAVALRASHAQASVAEARWNPPLLAGQEVLRISLAATP